MATRRRVSARDGADAVAMLDAEKRVVAESAADANHHRRCIGSAKFGIEAHEAPVTEFPAQPSQKDGLGRMCKPHWNAYTGALRRAALARKAEAEAEVPAGPAPAPAPEPARARHGRRTVVPEGGAQGDAG